MAEVNLGASFEDNSFAQPRARPSLQRMLKGVPNRDLRPRFAEHDIKEETRNIQQFLQNTILKADEFLEEPFINHFLLSFLSGGFVCFGAMLSIILSTGIPWLGLQRFMLGIGFSVGFIMVILVHGVLFTEMNVLLPVFMLSRIRKMRLRVWRLWITSWIGNVTGAVVVAYMIVLGRILWYPYLYTLEHLVEEKLIWKEFDYGMGYLYCISSAILGNWLIGMAAVLAGLAVSVEGKIIGILVPVITFVAIGAQHTPANMCYLFMALISGEIDLTLGDVLVWNLIPASIGNIIGGGVMVGGLFWFLHGTDREYLRDMLFDEEQLHDHHHDEYDTLSRKERIKRKCSQFLRTLHWE